jgi:uncharacterized protein (TIGR03382 family)
VAYDQRTVPRPQLTGCDIGAHEYAPGDKYATSVKSEPPGANCTLGGARLASGFDFNNNGVLDTVEERDVAYVCTGSDGSNGSNGVSSLVLTTTLPVGDANCAEGGVRIDVGLDNGDGGGTANNGVLEPGEIDSTSYVCSGTNGAAGADGADGADGAGCCDAGTRGAGGPMVLTVLAAAWLRRRRRA